MLKLESMRAQSRPGDMEQESSETFLFPHFWPLNLAPMSVTVNKCPTKELPTSSPGSQDCINKPDQG